MLQNPDGETVVQRDLSTGQLLETIQDVRVVHIQMLTQVLNYSSGRSLAQPFLQAVRKELKPTRSGRFPWQRALWMSAVRTISVERLTEAEKSKPWVVWSHDEPDYPVPVIELSKVFKAWRPPQ